MARRAVPEGALQLYSAARAAAAVKANAAEKAMVPSADAPLTAPSWGPELASQPAPEVSTFSPAAEPILGEATGSAPRPNGGGVSFLQVECDVPGCTVRTIRQPNKQLGSAHRLGLSHLRKLQLCTKHAAAKEGLFRQAQRRDKSLVGQLSSMSMEELCGYIDNFAETLPGSLFRRWL